MDILPIRRIFDRGNGRQIALVMRPPTIERLRNTCFRGKGVSKAGNFRLWDSFELMLYDDHITEALLEFLDDLHEEKKFETSYSFTVIYPVPVGWSSTVLRQRVSEADLETRKLNRRAQAKFVKNPKAEAPATHTITFVCELKLRVDTDTCGVAFIHSIYPGPDVGILEGDMTEQTGMVWYPWDNPGSLEYFQD